MSARASRQTTHEPSAHGSFDGGTPVAGAAASDASASDASDAPTSTAASVASVAARASLAEGVSACAAAASEADSPAAGTAAAAVAAAEASLTVSERSILWTEVSRAVRFLLILRVLNLPTAARHSPDQKLQ